MSFAMDVSKWANKAAGEVDKLRKALILELFSSVILDTPVDTGRLRGNWQITSSRPATGIVEITDPSGSSTIAKVASLVAGLPKEKDFKVYLTNGLPYAYRIEYEGYSAKAPAGMVRKNMLRISNNLRR